MKIIFCSDPIESDSPDSMYIDEVAAATRAGLSFHLIDYKAIAEENNAARAVRDIPVHKPVEAAVYRGWMLRASQYRALYEALLSRGIQLINDVDQYRYAQNLPESYPLIKEKTPRTVWMDTTGLNLEYDAVMELLLPFDGQSLVLRDFVKTEKRYWYKACYISSAADRTAVKNTVNTFVDLRGDALEGGLVFREFVELEPVGKHPRSSMPLAKEYRIFYLNNAPVMTIRYWEVDGDDGDDTPPLEEFEQIAQDVRSRFFTLDVAKTTDGEWMIIEPGDGQVANLPHDIDMDLLYKAFAGAS